MRTHALWYAIALAVCLVAPAQAQEESGQLLGRVMSAQGVPASGVRIELQSPNLLGTRRETTDARGYYRISGLPVGTYRLRLSLIGYRPVAIDSVAVLLGRATTMGEVVLEAEAVELGELVVKAEPALIDASSAATATNLPAAQFRNLPTDRNFRSIVSLAPQANLSFLPLDEVNIAGGTGPENSYFIDGVNITDPYLGFTSSNLPYNFVRELQVKEGGYEAEYGRATGGIINVITPSGGDQFGGEVFGFFTGNGLSASPRFALTEARESHFSNYDFGGSLGGPIVRQHVWFFGAYNPSFQRQQATYPGITLPDETHTRHLFATKLTWRAAPETDVTVTLHGDPSKERFVLLAYVPQTLLNADAIIEDHHDDGTVLSSMVRHRLGARTQVQLSAARFSHHRRFESPTERGRTEPNYRDLPAGIVAGGLGFFGETTAERWSLGANLSAGIGTHDLKGGVDYEWNRFKNFSDQSGPSGGQIQRFDDTTYIWSRVSNDLTVRNRIPTAYVQDSWRATDRLVVNLGLRWDGQYLTSATGDPAQSITDQWQPRLGIVYRLRAIGAHKAFGSYARFYEQLPLDLSTFYYNNATSTVVLQYDHDPREDPTGGDTVFSIFSPQVEPRRDLKGQSYDEFTLGYEGALSGTLRVGIRGVARRLRWAVEDAFNPDLGTFQVGNPGRRNLGFTPRARRRYTALVLTLEKPQGTRFDFLASYVLSRTSGNYEGLYDFQQTVPQPNVSLAFDFPELYPNSSGLLPNDRPHVLKFSGSYRFDWGVTVGTATSWSSGMPRNELGATAIGNPVYHAFLRRRGSAGRTPSVFDVNMRFAYALPAWGRAVRPKVSLDLFHLTNSRTTIRRDDVHYLAVDAEGNQTTINPGYNRGLNFQPPMSARLGLTLDFGGAP